MSVWTIRGQPLRRLSAANLPVKYRGRSRPARDRIREPRYPGERGFTGYHQVADDAEIPRSELGVARWSKPRYENRFLEDRRSPTALIGRWQRRFSARSP
jgi:hypothetical protein